MRKFKKLLALNIILALFLSVVVNFQLNFNSRLSASAETLDTSGLVTDGTVYDTVTYGTTTYVGGRFSYIGPNTGTGAPVTISTSALAGTYPKVNRDINVVISDGAGGWYVGGDFTSIGGVSKTNLAHITSGGAVDSSFTADPDSPVQSLLLSGSTLYVGGAFSNIGGQSRPYMASIAAATGIADSTDWQADGSVYDMALDGTTIYVVGMFSNIGGSYRSKAAALSTATALATSWNPFVQGAVYSIALDGTYAYLGGSFYEVSSVSVNNLASYSLAGSLSSWRPEPNSAVNDLELTGTTLYAGGSFSTIGSATRNSLASLDTGTGLVTSWDPNVAGATYPSVNDVEIVGSTIYVGGVFTTVGSSTRYNVAGIDSSSAAATSFNPFAGGTVNSVAVSGDTASLYVGGTFKSIGSGTARKTGLAAFNNSTNSVLSFDANLSGSSAAALDLVLSSDGANLYVGGDFTSIDGVSRVSLGVVDTASGNMVSGFDALLASSSYVYGLVLSGSTLYVGGRFSTLASSARNNLASVSASTGVVTSWDPGVTSGFSAYVYDLVLSGSTLYVGGNFTTAGGAARANLAAIDTVTGLATSWNPGISGGYFAYVYSIGLTGSTLYVGGSFTTAGGSSRDNLAAIDTATGLATSWNPGTNGVVYSLSLGSSTVYIGGDFTTAGGSSRSRVAGISLSTGGATSWNPGANADVQVVNLSTGHLFVGGNFGVFDSISMYFLAHYTVATNTAPSVSISSATPKTDGTGGVDITAVFSDTDSDTTLAANLEYKAGTDCTTAGTDATLDETDANTTATQGDPKVENDNTYALGNVSGYITTAAGSNTVSFDWLSMTDLPSIDSTVYCLRVTPYDGTIAGTVATTTLTVDNVVNVPAGLSLSAPSNAQVNVDWTANSNPTGTQYYAENVTAGSNSGWVTALGWSNTGLTCGTSYTYRVKSRNTGSVETAFTSSLAVSTLACADGGSSFSVGSSISSSSQSSESAENEAEVSSEDETEIDVTTEDESVEETVDLNQAQEAIEVVTDLITSTDDTEDVAPDPFVPARRIEQALNTFLDTVTDNERINYEILIDDELDIAVGALGDDVVSEQEDGEWQNAEGEPVNLEEQISPGANDPDLLEEAAIVEDVLEDLSVEDGDPQIEDIERLIEAERTVESIVEKDLKNKFDELKDLGGAEEFTWKVNGVEKKMDSDTDVYVTLSAAKAKELDAKYLERGENKLVIGPSTTLGDSTVSALYLALNGVAVDKKNAGENYFFGGKKGLKNEEILFPGKPKVTTMIEGKKVGKNVLLWLGTPKKNTKLNLFAIDKGVDPSNKEGWNVASLGDLTTDEGNKGTFVLDVEEDLPDGFISGGREIYLVVQDELGEGSVVDFVIDLAANEELSGVKLVNDLVAIGDPMGDEAPEAIGDPMGDTAPEAIGDPMGFESSYLYTSALLAQAEAVRGRDIAMDGVADMKYMTGYAKPGEIVVVTWKSLTYSSVVIADASEGYFEVAVPDVLEGGDHEALVYVYNDTENLISSVTSLLFGKGRTEG